MQIVELSSYIAAGATTTKWVVAALTINAVVIFCLSLKYGMGGRSKFDLICLLLAGAAICLWIQTKDPALAVYMSTLGGAIGYLPIIKKSSLWPGTESRISWSVFLVAAVLNVGALTSVAPVIALPPLCSLGLASIVASLLSFPRWKIRNLSRSCSVATADL